MTQSNKEIIIKKRWFRNSNDNSPPQIVVLVKFWNR